MRSQTCFACVLGILVAYLAAPLDVPGAVAVAAAQEGDNSAGSSKKKRRHNRSKESEESTNVTSPPETPATPPPVYGSPEKQSSSPPPASPPLVPVGSAAPEPASGASALPVPVEVPRPPEVAQSSRDHATHMGHWALASFNATSMAVGNVTDDTPPTYGSQSLTLTAIGTRYWLTQLGTVDLGLEFALGIFVDTSNVNASTTTGGSTTTSNQKELVPSALYLHLGVPLALFNGKHYAFEIIPDIELGVGWGQATIPAAAASGGTATDLSLNGFTVKIGINAGPEISFGYFDIPELVVQPTVGLALSYSSFGAGSTVGTTKSSLSYDRIVLASVATRAGLSVFYYF